MEYIQIYLELMADLKFAVLSSSFGVGLIVLVGLLAALRKKKPAAPDPLAGADAPTEWGGEMRAAPAPAVKAAPAPDATQTLISPPAEGPAHAAPAPVASVDLTMYEALVRRMSVMESELKREPIYLDPLLKRLMALEKRVEELGASPSGGSAGMEGAAGENNPEAAPGREGISKEAAEEILALKEKVDGLQRILEHLAEGPVPPS